MKEIKQHAETPQKHETFVYEQLKLGYSPTGCWRPFSTRTISLLFSTLKEGPVNITPHKSKIGTLALL